MGIIKNTTVYLQISMSTFEIQLQAPKSEELPSELKNRLFISKKEVTLQEIDEKLQNAAAKRQELKQVRLPAQERIAQTQGRRESFEKAQGLKVQAQLGKRMSAAEERRLNMRQSHLDRIRTHNNRVIERRQNFSTEKEGAKDQLGQRQAAAEERRNNQRKQALDKVLTHNKKVAERRENLSADKESAKILLGKKLSAAEERRN